MKVISLDHIAGSSREVRCPNGGFISYRYLLAGDGVGFSVHRTVVPVGETQHWHYLNHVEACYCISGKGVLVDTATGNEHIITPGTMYVLDNNDDHTFRAIEEVTFISIFNPPCIGEEVHDERGSYPLLSANQEGVQ